MAGSKNRNPFMEEEKNPFAEEPISADPFNRLSNTRICCPVCNESDPEKLDNRNTPTQVLRSCRTCGNKWSGGNVGGLSNLPFRADAQPPKEEPYDPEPPIYPQDAFRRGGQ